MELLRARGAEAISVPVMELELLLTDAELEKLGERIVAGAWDDLVFTSANAVRLALPGRGLGNQAARIFAIGPGTAAAVARRGWEVEPLPLSFVAESLAESLLQAGMSGRRVLLPRAAGARPVLPDALARAGAELHRVDLYRMVPDHSSRPALESALADPQLDCILFASGSSVRCFQALCQGRAVAASVLVACIGPITADAAEEAGLHPQLVADEHSLTGLLRALEMRLGPVPENGPRHELS